jgi:hypothetical protein
MRTGGEFSDNGRGVMPVRVSGGYILAKPAQLPGNIDRRNVPSDMFVILTLPQ